MSSADKSHQSPKSAAKPKDQTDAKTDSVSQPPSSAETKMDQPQDSPLTAAPSAPHHLSATMSSTEERPSSENPLSPDHSPAKSPAKERSASKEPSLAKPSTAASPSAAVPPAKASEAEEGNVEPQASLATPAPAAIEAEADDNNASETDEQTSDEQNPINQSPARQQPIPPASEPMQYRAIGLVRGKYEASEEQFTRGNLLTDDGVSIGAVLLGRVMSLVKKHLDLAQPHLWVVYPRTREKGDSDLHVQIVGVWEPEKLNRIDSDGSDHLDHPSDTDFEAAERESELEDEAEAERSLASEIPEADLATPEQTEAQAETPLEPEQVEPSEQGTTAGVSSTEERPSAVTEAASSSEALAAAATPQATSPSSTDSDIDDKYFSVRGEIIYQSLEEERLLVKIRRVPKPGTDESKAFKVSLKGKLEGKAVGYFWDLNVQREGNELVVRDGTLIAAVPPQKRKGSDGGRRGGYGDRSRQQRRPQSGPPGRKRWNGPRDGQQQRPPSRSSDRPSPAQGRNPLPKPVIKRRNNPETGEG